MADPVPYDPKPQVAASDQSIGSMRVQADPSMFGGMVGQAVEHLGQTLQTSGSELFDRAYAMQTTNIAAQANEAQANATDEAAKIRANYQTLQGNDAVQGYDQYQKDIHAAYDKARAT